MRRRIAGILLIVCAVVMGSLGVYGFIAVTQSWIALAFSTILAAGTLALGIWAIRGRPAP